MGNQDAPKAPAGWYPIEEGKPGERYWDGNAWSGETRGLEDVAIPVAATINKEKNKKILLISIGALVVTLALIFSVVMGSASSKTLVPEVSGLSFSDALEIIEAEGFVAEVIEVSPLIGSEAGVVLGTTPAEGEWIKSGSKVKVKVSDGSGSKTDSGDNSSSSTSTEWQPSGFTAYNEELAYMWVSGGPNPCGSMACSYFTMNVSSHYGCPNGIYVEINMTSGGVVVDWSNDTVPALAAGQTAQLQFVSYQNNVGSAQVASMSCH